MTEPLDRARLAEAFEALGADLAARDVFVEIAVYGGSALLMQFDWQRATDDVDAVVREGFDEATLAPSVAAVGRRLGLPADWLNDAVGMFTPLDEPDTLFDLAGSYPTTGTPGLRVLLATPRYLLVLGSTDRGGKDLDDARRLALHVGISRVDELRELYRVTYDEPPAAAIERRLAAVLA